MILVKCMQVLILLNEYLMNMFLLLLRVLTLRSTSLLILFIGGNGTKTWQLYTEDQCTS